tara:strand:- start:72 stop:227 length:156 start_codon:yes stop_codon:yes gene_type:complete
MQNFEKIMQNAYNNYQGGICEAAENIYNEKLIHHKKELLSEDVLNLDKLYK